MTRRCRALSAWLFGLTLLICSVAEMVLIEVKYKIFTGGFLQSHQLATWEERGVFIVAFALFNLVLYGGSYLIWRALLRRVKISESLIALHFFLLAGMITAVSLVAQFQLHKYFADAMNLALIKDIGGGDLGSALMYVLDEAFLFIVGIFLLIGVYVAIYKAAKGYLLDHDRKTVPTTPEKPRGRATKVRLWGRGLAVFVLLLAGLGLINAVENQRYNLNRTNSYRVLAAAADTLSDFDRDGYGSFRHPQDAAIWDSSIYPGALDIPDNGIDENGLFGDFTGFSPVTEYEIPAAPARKPRHVVVIMMESTRADIIGKKIDGVLVAPHITALAAEGRAVTQAYSHTGYTGSSLASFFSGRVGAFRPRASLFHILKQQGYRIALFSGQDESWSDLDRKLGTRATADHFFDAQEGAESRVFASRLPSSIKLSESTLWENFSGYGAAADWDVPQFVYFNMQAAHFPYFHSRMARNFITEGIPRAEINAENKNWLDRTYWNALSHADHYVGEIVAYLKDRGIWEDTLLILSGDHGEELFDDGHLGHGFLLSEVQTRVPLIISRPDFRTVEPMGHADMKTLLLSYLFPGADAGDVIAPEKRSEKRNVVFQMTGGLANPGRIGLRHEGGEQIVFDRRKMTVRPRGAAGWIPYKKALNDPVIGQDLAELVHHWENLRWQDHLATVKVE